MELSPKQLSYVSRNCYDSNFTRAPEAHCLFGRKRKNEVRSGAPLHPHYRLRQAEQSGKPLHLITRKNPGLLR
jgi:hypothetical protein